MIPTTMAIIIIILLPLPFLSLLEGLVEGTLAFEAPDVSVPSDGLAVSSGEFDMDLVRDLAVLIVFETPSPATISGLEVASAVFVAVMKT